MGTVLRKTAAPLALAVLLGSPVLAADLADVKARGKLVLATFPQETSHFSRPGSGDDYEGFDIDLVTTFAKRLDVELEIHPVGGYDELIPALLSGEADIVASSFTVTDEREQIVDFSAPYFPVVVQVVVPEDSSIRSISDLAGRTGSALPGSSQERAMMEIGDVTIHHVRRSLDHWQALREGEADFAFVDSTSLFRDRERSTGTRVAFNLPEVSGYGCAFATGSDLRNAFDAHLTYIRSTSYIYDLIRRNFGEGGVQLYELAARGE